MELLRHDAIQLYPGVKEEDFEEFMIKDLMPLFKRAYGGPATRKSVALLSRQSLLKEQRCEGVYVWAMAWEGRVEDVQDPLFTRVSMEAHEDTLTMLQKLASFGERMSPHIYTEAT
jgi:hypothetical protein